MDLNSINMLDINLWTDNIFPSCIHIVEINNFDKYKDKLIEETYQERDKNPTGRRVSNYEGWQSDQSYIDQSKSEILKKVILDSLFTLKLQSISPNFSMTVSGWKNINMPGSFNFKHDHPKSHLSGVLWIKAPVNSGDIVFQSPQEFVRHDLLDCYTDQFKIKTEFYNTYRYTPIEGRMLVFPSDLQHLVDTNKSEEDRISYSFNIRFNKLKSIDSV